MFTGLVEETGKVVSFEEKKNAWHLVISCEKVLSDVTMGASIAVNGCCLTVVQFDEKELHFELLEETVRLTGFSQLQKGDPVNLERCLTPSTRMGGHFVSGHIDAQGTIIKLNQEGKNIHLKVQVPDEFLHYLVYKGSIAIDGISLTVASVEKNFFSCWIIPHTLEVTNLNKKSIGDFVNLEFDILAKYVERMHGDKPVG